jgi:hypothetical protein
VNTANRCREIEPKLGSTIEKLDAYSNIWRETKVKSMKPRDIPIYSCVLTKATDKYVKYYFKLLAEVGGM